MKPGRKKGRNQPRHKVPLGHWAHQTKQAPPAPCRRRSHPKATPEKTVRLCGEANSARDGKNAAETRDEHRVDELCLGSLDMSFARNPNECRDEDLRSRSRMHHLWHGGSSSTSIPESTPWFPRLL